MMEGAWHALLRGAGLGISAVTLLVAAAAVDRAGAVPAPELPGQERCIGEPLVVARTNIPGDFTSVRGTDLGPWLAALSQKEEHILPRGDRLLVFVADAPYRAARRLWPEGSGVFFLMREGCMVWHRRLPPDTTEPLIESMR